MVCTMDLGNDAAWVYEKTSYKYNKIYAVTIVLQVIYLGQLGQ